MNNYIPSDSDLNIKGEFENHSIVFNIDGIEMMKINKIGFYWKGILVENDKEIYADFKKFLETNNNEKC